MQGKEGRRDMGDEVDRKERVRPLTLLRRDAEVGRSKLTPHPLFPHIFGVPDLRYGRGEAAEISLFVVRPPSFKSGVIKIGGGAEGMGGRTDGK